MVENPPCNAGDVVLIPGQETKIPMIWGAAKPKHCNKRSPCPATKTQRSQKKKKKASNKIKQQQLLPDPGHSVESGAIRVLPKEIWMKIYVKEWAHVITGLLGQAEVCRAA